MPNVVSALRAPPYRVLLVLAAVVVINACAKKITDFRPEQAGTLDSPASDIKIEGSSAGDRLKFGQGISALSVRNYPEARRIFTELIRSNPRLSGPYANLALINFKQKNYRLAFKQVNKAIELNPLKSQAYHLRAQIRLQRGEIKKARDDYQRAIDLNPKYLNAHYNLALLYDIYLQEIALAINHYSIYLSLLDKEDQTLKDWINHLKGTLENG